MAKWNVGDLIEVTKASSFLAGIRYGHYGDYQNGDVGVIVGVHHNYLIVNFEANGHSRNGYQVLKRECEKTCNKTPVLRRIQLIHARQASRYPFMEKRYAV